MASTPYDGKIIIATPKVTSKIFKQSVIYIQTDDDVTGTVGIMTNSPMDRDQATIWSQEIGWQYPERIQHGGPVERQLGYIVHSNDYARDSTVSLNDDLSYTGGKIVVRDINNSHGPHSFVLLTGFCEWQPGQLAAEIDHGMWIAADFDVDYFFHDLGRNDGWNHSINIAAHNYTQKMLDTVDKRLL